MRVNDENYLAFVFADIASDKQHIEELRHAIHVKEVIEGNTQ